MPKKHSQTASRETPKNVTITKIVDHIISTYKPHEAPIILMWRETINGFHLADSPSFPVWVRDDNSVHEHWKRFGPGVIDQLRLQYKLTVVSVSRKIREFRGGHAIAPDRDETKRTDAWYKSCLPGPHAETFGLVAFPRDHQQDHPLVLYWLDQRGKATASGYQNAGHAVSRAHDLGMLSKEEGAKIVEHMEGIAKKAFEDQHPLFKQL